METIITVIIVFALGVFALTVFGMTITKKAMDDFDDLSRFVDKMVDEPNHEIMNDCLEEWQMLFDGGRVPVDNMVELRIRIIKKFR